MNKIIAPLLLAVSASAYAAPVTLTAYGTHVQLGSSQFNQPYDWRLILTYDSSQTGGAIDVNVEGYLYDRNVSGTAISHVAPNSFWGGMELVLDGHVVGDLSWSFGTVGDEAPQRSSDLDGTSYIYSFYTGQYTEYIVDGVTVSAVPEPGVYGLMLGGFACIGAISASRRRKAARRGSAVDTV